MAGTIETGERYAKSPMTGEYYRVTKWEEREGAKPGHIIAREKEPVAREQVPDEWLEVLEASDDAG